MSILQEYKISTFVLPHVLHLAICSIFFSHDLIAAVVSILRFSVPLAGSQWSIEDLNRQSSPENGWGEAYQYSAATLTETMAIALGVKVF